MNPLLNGQTIVHRNFEISEIKSLGENEIGVIINSGRQDRHGEVLDMKGLDLKNYKANPVVAWSHDYYALPVGQCVNLKKTEGGELIGTIKFAVDEYDFAKTVYKLYKGGYLRTVSIGFIPYEMEGNVYTKSEMLEFSCVMIPADPKALASAKTNGINMEQLISLKHIINSKKNMTEEEKKKQEEAEAAEAAKATAAEETKKAIAEVIKSELGSFREELRKEFDAPVKKDISVQGGPVSVNPVAVQKEEKLKLYIKGLINRNFSDYLHLVGKDAMTTGNTGAVLPPTEFIAEVLRLEEEYGAVRPFVTVRRTTRTSITGLTGDDDVAIYETGEAGSKKGTKTTYAPYVISFKKFAAIAPITEELEEDSAVNLWEDLTSRFARAYSKKDDELVLTHSTSGIVNLAGAATEIISGDSIEDITFDNINQAMYKVPSPSMIRGRFFFNHTILGVLQRVKDLEGRYILQMGPDGPASGTVWGRPYTLTEVLPGLSLDAPNTGFIVFGDLKNTILAERTQMKMKIFDSGTVEDADEEDINLLTDDVMALRVVKRFNAKTIFENAYCVIKTGNTAS